MAHVTWDGGGGDDTSWTNAANWSGDTLPGAGDDVTIDVAANPTIRLGSGVQSIRSLVSNEALNITGGSLRVAGTAQVNGSLAIGNATLFGGTWSVSAGIQVTGTGTLDGVTVNGNVDVQDGKSLTATNAAAINGNLSLGTNSGLTAGLGVTLSISPMTEMSGGTIAATDGAALDFPLVTQLTGVNLLASKGARLTFPAVTRYTGDNYADTTIQASGVGSKIDLSHLETLAGGGWHYYNNNYTTHIKALAGGEVDLAGAVGRNPSGGNWNNIVVDGAGSVLGVSGVTSLACTTLTVNTAPGLTFSATTELTEVSVTAGTGITMSFPVAQSLTAVNLAASGGGQILFAAATSYTGDNYRDTTIQASGVGSKIDLSHLETLAGGGWHYYNNNYTTHIKALAGGVVDLAGAIGRNPSGGNWNNIVLDGAGSRLGVDAVTNLTASNLSVTGEALTFPAVTSLSSVTLLANGGGQVLFPAVTSYTGDNYADTTIQASGVGSKIDLSHLETLAGGGWHYYNNNYTTHIKALAGGEVVLAGAIGRNPSGGNWNDIVVDGAGSVLGVSGVTSLACTTLTVNTAPGLTFSATTELTEVSVTAGTGITMSFPVAQALTAVNLAASGGGQILFPAATSYTGDNYRDTTIQASGVGSKIDLSHLETLAGGGWHYYNNNYTTHIKALAGGEVDLAGAIGRNPSGGNWNNIVVNGAGSVLGVSGVTSLACSTLTVNTSPGLTFSATTELTEVSVTAGTGITMSFPVAQSLTAVNLAASGGGQILFPAATSYTGDNYRDTTIEANGVGSKIDLSHLETLAGGGWHYYNNNYTTRIKALAGGEVDLAGAIGRNSSGGNWNDIVVDGAGSVLGVSGVTSLACTTLTVNTTPGLTFSATTELTEVSVTAGTGITMSFPVAQSLTAVNLAASGGGQILFAAATSYTGDNYRDTTIQASGVGSKIDLSHLETLAGGGWHYYNNNYTTHLKALAGGKVELAGAIGRNPTGGNPNVLTLDGAGSLYDLSKVTSIGNSTLVATNGAVWVFPAGWAPELKSGNSLSTSGDGSRFINRATLAISGATLAINTSAFTNEGTLNPLADGAFDFNGSFSIAHPGILTGTSSGRITVTGDLRGDTRNASLFAPLAEVRFDGAGTAANPQHLEAMSDDRGPSEVGFVANFAYRNLTLANNTYVRLVNDANNTASRVPEAVYVDTLVVPAGTTLDLNHLHLYARTRQIGGTILKGDVQLVEPGPSATVSIASPSADTNDVLTAVATKWGPEGHAVSLTFVWKVNGVEKRTYSSNTALTDTFDLSVPGQGDRGDTITVTVTPRDGTVAGVSASDTVTVVGDDDPPGELEAAVRLVRTPASSDHITDAGFVDYVSLGSVPAGSTYFAEIWLRDRGTLRGTVGGSFDLAYTTDHADATAIGHGSVFGELTSGTFDDALGLVDNLGGGTFNANEGTTQWVRLGFVTIHATSAGDATFTLGHDLSPGAANLHLAEIGAGSIDWSLVQFPDAAVTVQHTPNNVQVYLVPRIEPSAADAAADRPAPDRSPFWVLESGAAAGANRFYVEVWVCSDPAYPAAVRDGSVSVRFDPQYVQAVAIDHGGLFTESLIEDIDNATGVVSLGGATPAAVQVTRAYVLLGRIAFRGNAPVDEVAHQAGPYNANFVPTDGPRRFVQADIGQVGATFQPVPAAAIKAMIYDIDDSGVVDYGDFSYFVPAFDQAATGTEPPYKWWADFDADGAVDFGDFSFFVTAFAKDFSDAGIVFPTGGHGQSVAGFDAVAADFLHPWQNPGQAEDVNGDELVTPMDVLILTNRLNTLGGGELPHPSPFPDAPPPYWDVNGDDVLSALDALAVINFLNSHGELTLAPAEGEGEADAGMELPVRAVDESLRADLPLLVLPTCGLPEYAPAGRTEEPCAALDKQSVDLAWGLAEATPRVVKADRFLLANGAAEDETDLLMADDLELAQFAAWDDADFAASVLARVAQGE